MPNYFKDSKDKVCTVKVIDGKQFVFTPKGEKLPYTIMTRVHDEVHEQTTVLVKMFCKLEDNK